MDEDDTSEKIDDEDVRRQFAGSCEFFWGAADIASLPPEDRPEVAFAGRSNVGKSSLINALLGRKALARISQTPGRTQQLNFFNLGDKLTLVDLPGYGYAKVSKTKAASWQETLKLYLKGRSTLRLALILVDARHGLKPPDLEHMRLMDQAAVPYRIVLTKADKAGDSVLSGVCADLREKLKNHPAAFPEPHATSALKRQGLFELQKLVFAQAIL